MWLLDVQGNGRPRETREHLNTPWYTPEYARGPPRYLREPPRYIGKEHLNTLKPSLKGLSTYRSGPAIPFLYMGGISNDCEGYIYSISEDPFPDVQIDRSSRISLQQPVVSLIYPSFGAWNRRGRIRVTRYGSIQTELFGGRGECMYGLHL